MKQGVSNVIGYLKTVLCVFRHRNTGLPSLAG